jgi:hypothetical protein
VAAQVVIRYLPINGLLALSLLCALLSQGDCANAATTVSENIAEDALKRSIHDSAHVSSNDNDQAITTLSREVNSNIPVPQSVLVAQLITPNRSIPDAELPVPQDPPTVPPASEKPNPAQPESPPNPAQRRIVEQPMLRALTNSNNRFPWIVNPTGEAVFSPTLLNPLLVNPDKQQTQAGFELQSAGDRIVLNRLNLENLRSEEQFYWVLPGNRIVLETTGWQGQAVQQGQSTDTKIEQVVQLEQALWGMQFVSVIPTNFTDLTGNIDPDTIAVKTIAAEIINAPNTPAGIITLNPGNENNPPRRTGLLPSIGVGSTYSTEGGSSLFENLVVDNVPRVLQAFPTHNLQPLLGGDGLFPGAVIPNETLAEIGLVWGDPITGRGATFAPERTSNSGIKIAQGGKFDNTDLLNSLVNPDLSDRERRRHYYNSLFWVSLGQRAPIILSSSRKTDQTDWYQFQFGRPHNRALLQYDATKSQATYTNVFANPGLSLSISLERGQVDTLQALNSTAGMMLGSIFSLLRPASIDQSLQDARSRHQRQDSFAPLSSNITPIDRAQINRRLTNTLASAKRNTGLAQSSGQITLPSVTTPNGSSLFQVQVGNYRRAVQFFQFRRDVDPGETFVSKMRPKQEFGPLTFIGQPINTNRTRILPSNQSLAAQISLIGNNGQTLLVEEFNSTDFVTVPLAIRMVDFVSDNIELSRIDRVTTSKKQFNGYLTLPAVEGSWSGSSGKFSYGVNLGTWLNFDGDQAFNVRENNSGQLEPTLGTYLNARASAQFEKVFTDAKGKPRATFLQSPTIRLHWNSAMNGQNATYLNLSHSFVYQSNRLSYALTPGMAIFADNRKLSPVGFLQGQLQIGRQFSLQGVTELGDNLFVSLEARQQINSRWSIGGYWQNYRSINRGLNTRLNGSSYGLLLQHQPNMPGVFWKARVGHNDRDWEAKIETGIRF